MTDQDVLEARQKRFHVANNPVRTLEEARKFIADVGFCLVYPLRRAFPAPLPTFIGAFIGSDQAVPYQHIAFADPRAKEATELMVRLLRDKAAYEVNFHEDSALLVSSEIFPYYYGVIGEKGSVKLAPKLTGAQAVSRIAFDIYNAIEKHGALTKAQLKRVAVMAQTGLARAIHPVHTPLDGDVVFAVATGRKPPPDPLLGLTELGTAAAATLARAVARGVFEAKALPFPEALPSWRDRFGVS